jgi:hypothetical protein
MRRLHPNPQMSIPITIEVWHQLLGGSCYADFEKEDWEIAAEAIGEWARRNNPDSLPMPAAHGYQWKSQFLPDGTLLRTVFGGKNHHCLVQGDQILYNGKAVSPSGFVNAVGGIRRNAWRCTWILFPDSKDWKLADSLRTRSRPRRSRKPAGDLRQSPAMRSSAAGAPDNVPSVTEPLSVQMEPVAANVSEAPGSRHASPDQVPRNNPNSAGRNRQQDTGITLSPPLFTRGTDRRINVDDRMATLLRQELRPLLYRMCAFDGMPSESGTAFDA